MTEASGKHSIFTSFRQTENASSDVEPLLALTPPPTQTVSGTLPTWVDSGRLHVDVPGRNVRPRLRVQSVPATIVDDVEEDASAVSTVPARSRSLRRLRFVSGRARDDSTESVWPDAVHVMNIADPDSEVLSDTATDPDLWRNERSQQFW